jgi:uncharacterized membrane protein YfcA
MYNKELFIPEICLMFVCIVVLMLILSGICIITMFAQLRDEKNIHVSKIDTLKLSISGVIAFIADTIGVGSFATNIALAKTFKTFPDEQLPAMVNGAQIIPGVIESLFFMQMFDVDKVTLITLVLGTCIGGLLGGKIVCKLSKQTIRCTMITCFSLIIFLLIGNELQILPIGGHLTALHGHSLIIGFLGMIVCGALTSAGIGLFALVQGVLFLLQVSPAVAFPIMTTAGAMQQPLTTMIFLKERKIPIKKTLIISLAGCVGVLLIMPIFKWFSAKTLHVILIVVLIYNIINIGKAYLASKKEFNLIAKESF